MAVVFDAHGGVGKVACYTVPDNNIADDAPLTNPLGNLSRVKFHSDFDYVRVLSVWEGTLNLPAIAVGSTALRTASYTLFAHGRPGQPWVLGDLVTQGQRVAFLGSVPVQQPARFGPVDPYARFVSLGADGTNVIAYEYCPLPGARNDWAGLSAISIPIRVFVTDELL